MPKPHHTFIHISKRERVKHFARSDKGRMHGNAEPAPYDKQRIQRTLEEAERKLLKWIRDLKDGSSMSRKDTIRKNVAELVGQLEQAIAQSQELNLIKEQIALPKGDFVRAPTPSVSADALLACIVVWLKVTQVLIQTWRRR